MRHSVARCGRKHDDPGLSTVAHREPLGVAHREPVWRRDRTPDMKVVSWPPGQLAPRARRAVSCFFVCSARKLWPVISTKCAPWVRRSSAADDGTVGVEEIPFIVRNGPGIDVIGLSTGKAVQGRVPIVLN